MTVDDSQVSDPAEQAHSARKRGEAITQLHKEGALLGLADYDNVFTKGTVDKSPIHLERGDTG